MATDSPQEVINKESIITMRKDIKRLREFDAKKERTKIVNTKILTESDIPSTPITPTQTPPPVIKIQPKQAGPSAKEFDLSKALTETPDILSSPKPEPITTTKEPVIEDSFLGIDTAKDLANEEEKQQIYLLESQKTDLKKQLSATSKTQEPALILEKNKILVDQRHWQERLKPLEQDQEKLEQELTLIEQTMISTQVPREKQNLQKQRQKLETERQLSEKKVWAVQTEIAKLQDRLNKLNEKYSVVNTGSEDITKNIEALDNSLRKIYANILERERTAKQQEKVAEAKRVSEAPRLQKESEEKQRIQTARIEERNFAQNIPQTAKEQLAKTSLNENERRKKFMEDIEAWASQDNKQDK